MVRHLLKVLSAGAVLCAGSAYIKFESVKWADVLNNAKVKKQ